MIFANRQVVERAVRLWDAHGFSLCPANLMAGPEEAAVNTRGRQSFVAKLASSIRVGEWHHNEIAFLHFAHVSADCLDNTNRFMAHRPSAFCRRQIVVRPKIA